MKVFNQIENIDRKVEIIYRIINKEKEELKGENEKLKSKVVEQREEIFELINANNGLVSEVNSLKERLLVYEKPKRKYTKRAKKESK